MSKYVVEYEQVAVRCGPSMESPLVGIAYKGDEVEAEAEGEEDFSQDGWIKLREGSVIRRCDRRGRSKRAVDESSFMLRKHKKYGVLLRRKLRPPSKPSETDKTPEGQWSKKEMLEIIAKLGSTMSLDALPLEARVWTKDDLEMYVMSEGAVRPKTCSIDRG